MKYYKNSKNMLFVDPILKNHNDLVEISKTDFDSEIEKQNIISNDYKKELIFLELEKIDNKKTRALTDFAINGDKTRLLELEAEAQELREQLKGVSNETENNI